jgi:hypothetical protein
MLSGLGCIELIAHYYTDIYDADKRRLSLCIRLAYFFLLCIPRLFTFPNDPLKNKNENILMSF